jgi:hypothetical protein
MEGFQRTANENIPSDNIKSARRGDAITILGRPPIFIKKVPYQLQQLPFWDTSNFCDPADAGCVFKSRVIKSTGKFKPTNSFLQNGRHVLGKE